MTVQKTVAHSGKTLLHGSFRSRETIYACPAKCRHAGKQVTARAAGLARLLPPRSVAGYDVIVEIGLQRFVQHRQRGEIQTDLQTRYGLSLSSGEISALTHRFLLYLEALHWNCAPHLRAAQDSDGGWPLHLDATGENGRGTTVTIYSGWRGWVLHAWKAPTERSEFILPGLNRVAAAFGPPCAIMRDLGRAVTEAAAAFAASQTQPISILACHYHFLADIGADLLESGHNHLRDLFRTAKVLPQLRAFVRLYGRNLGESIGDGREALRCWLANQLDPIPEGVHGLTVVRSLAQWALDYHADSSGQGFPFDRPWLDLYGRCLHLSAAIRTFLKDPPTDAKVRKSLEKLHHILRPVDCDVPPFTTVAASLLQRANLFDRLRTALRLENKTPASAASPEENIWSLNDVQSAVETLATEIRQQRPARGPAKELRQAIDLILNHLDRHGPHLWGHAIPLGYSGSNPQRIRLVERTNDDLESLFHRIKHGERRRSGRKFLTHDFETLPAAAALAMNLRHADYVSIVCGALDRLPEAFAQLDAVDRSRSIAAGTVHKTTTETASLSTTDKRIVRQPAMTDRIYAAAAYA